MSHQLSHKENRFTPREFDITLICDHLESPANQGSLFRICEAFGVKEIIFYGNPIDINSSRLKRTARSTQKLIPYKSVTELNEVFTQLKSQNTLLIGLEITTNSTPISKITATIDDKIALFIGSEKNGINEELLQQLDAVYHIPMYGTNSSMNVIQATGIALHALTNKLREF